MEELEQNVETLREQNENAAESKTGQPNMNIPGQSTCPRCGNQFDPKEKKCPHCGLKNNLKLCKTCGATIAKNAKRCPKCGAKNKKPIYNRVWFWVLIVFVLLRVFSGFSKAIEADNTENAVTTQSSAEETTDVLSSEESALVGRWSASKIYILDQMKSSDMAGAEFEMEFNADHTGKMITSSNGTTSFEWGYEETTDKGDMVYTIGSNVMVAIVGNRSNMSQYAGDLMVTSDQNTVFILEHNGAGGSTKPTASTSSAKTAETLAKSKVVSSNVSIGKQNALKKANEYLNVMAFSYSGLIEQLEYEGFSTEDATYAVDHCGADWMEQAAKKAEEYLNTMAFSRSGLIDQLEYEGFTSEQAKYGAEQNGY